MKFGKPVVIKKFWIPGFFNQKNFLHMLVQKVAYDEKISLERLRINFSVVNEKKNKMKSKSNRTFYITGMWIYGAKWSKSKGSICDLSPNETVANVMPPI